MLREQEEVFKKSLGREFAKYVLGKVTIEIEESLPDKFSQLDIYKTNYKSKQLPKVTVLVFNAITNTTFTYTSSTMYMDYFIAMHTTEMIARDLLKEYRKYVYALFYKKPTNDSNSIVL